MADLVLKKRFFDTYPVIQGSISDDLEPLRNAFLDSIRETSSHLGTLHADLAGLSGNLHEIAGGVASLQSELSFQLNRQSDYLAAEVETLHSIDEALRTPAKIRAAERIGDAGVLLRTERYELALKCGSEAMDADPTHPGGFAAAGYALVGLNRTKDAIWHFDEADLAVRGREPFDGTYAQMSARCRLIENDAASARPLLEGALNRLSGDPLFDGPRASILYDLALACAQCDDDGAAASHVASAGWIDERYAQLAIVDQVFDGHPIIRHKAIEVAAEIARKHEERRRQLAEADEHEKRLGRLNAAVPTLTSRFTELDPLWRHDSQLRAQGDSLGVALSELPQTLSVLSSVDLKNFEQDLDRIEGRLLEIQQETAEVRRLRWHLIEAAAVRLIADGWHEMARSEQMPQRIDLERAKRSGLFTRRETCKVTADSQRDVAITRTN